MVKDAITLAIGGGYLRLKGHSDYRALPGPERRIEGNAQDGAILIGSSMTMSFLAGLMIVNMKDIIARRAPFLSYINPATLITDSFYSLYVFDNHRRFFLNVGLLILISSVMCILSVLRLRRDRYASL